MKQSKLFHKKFFIIDLQLFAEGGAEGGTASSGAMGVTGTAAVSQKGVKSNPLANVKYGIQTEDDAQDTSVRTRITDADGYTAQSIDRNAEFEKLIKGEYKDLYDAKMQDTIQRRLKSTKETVDKYNSLTPMFEKLSAKYGVDATDVDALMKAIDEDDSYYEEEALDRGISVEEVKRIHKIERENADFRKQMKEQREKENADRVVANWMKQSDQLKSVYPSFNLEAELQNPKFAELLRVPGVDVRTAYELIHKDEIIAGAMQFAVNNTEKKLTNKIIANGARPSENGISSQSASVTKSDVTKLTNADIDEINRQVARGRKITFG